VILVGVMETIYMDYADKTLVDLNLDYHRKEKEKTPLVVMIQPA